MVGVPGGECSRDGCQQTASVTVQFSDPHEHVRYCTDCAGWAKTLFGDDVERVTTDGSDPKPTIYGGP